MRLLFALILLVALPAPATLGATVEGVSSPEKIDVADSTLSRNGTGVRTAFFMNVDVAGLYVTERSQDVQALLAADRPRQIQLQMLKKVEKSQFSDSVRAGFEKNCKDKLPALQERIDTFLSLLPETDAGDTLRFTDEPGVGTRIAGTKLIETVIPGKDFADAPFLLWLGSHPVDEELKKGLLSAT